MSNNKKNRLQQFVDSLPSDPESDSQFAMVVSADSSSYGGDNTSYCSNTFYDSCRINWACTNYDKACGNSTNRDINKVDTCKNERIPGGQVDATLDC